MPTGYCTVDDVRRALQETVSKFDSGAWGESSHQVVVDAITAQTEWLEKKTDRHWYAPNGITEDDEGLIATAPVTRDDEHDISTHAGFVHGASERDRRRLRANSDALLEAGPRYERRRKHYRDPKQEIRLAFGDLHDETIPAYTRITFDRRYVQALNELHVVNENGAFDDWVADSAYDGGVGNTHRGKDYWVRINNSGVSELYLNVHSMDDDIPSFSNAVYVDLDHGHEGLPQTIRRAVAFRAGAELLMDDRANLGIPADSQLVSTESKKQAMENKAEELLEVYL